VIATQAPQAMDDIHVVFFDVGKADSILIYSNAFAVLIDAGTNKTGEGIAEKIAALGIETLDVFIVTHFDKDHVGGADKIIESLDVRRVLMPVYEKDGKQYTQFTDAMEEAGIAPEALSANAEFSLGGAAFYVDVPNQAYYGEDEENDFSLVTRMEYGRTAFLFAGDCENARLQELLREGVETCDVLKVPHHGVAEFYSAAFFEACAPRYAVITSSDEDLEEEQVLEALQRVGAQVMLTRMGDVQMDTNGVEVSARQ